MCGNDHLLENRIKTLRRVTDLVLDDAERLTEEQIKVFDGVLCLLIRRIEGRALVAIMVAGRQPRMRRLRAQ